jgi:chromosome segregation ATPase
MCVCACVDEHEKQLETSRKREAELQGEIAALQAKLRQAEAEATRDLRRLERECARLRAAQQQKEEEVHTIRKQTAHADDERARERQLLTDAQSELENLREEVDKAAEHEARAADLQAQLETAKRQIAEARSAADTRLAAKETQWSKQCQTLEGAVM